METTMPDQQRELRTQDLALATTLRLHGHEPIRMEVNDDRHGVWVFCGDGALHQIAEDYHDGCAEVEPKDYNQVLGRTRGELYRFLRREGIEPPRRSR